MLSPDRKLRVFLCHASQDKPIVRELYQRLSAEGWINPWLDEEKILPGQNYSVEVDAAIQRADIALICLSNHVYDEKENQQLNNILEIADSKSSGILYVIPVRLEDCAVVRRLRQYQWADMFNPHGYKMIVESLVYRASSLGISIPKQVLSESSPKLTSKRPLRIFLGHASQDKPIVRELYQRLSSEGWIEPWLDEEELLPGQDWDLEIEKAVETADVVIACISNNSVNKEGYVQRELRYILDIALEKPIYTTFVIPMRLDNCNIPRRYREWQTLDYFPLDRHDWAYEKLLASLIMRANDLAIRDSTLDEKISEVEHSAESQVARVFVSYSRNDVEFVKKLASDLQALGLDVWWDISGLQGGDNWVSAIQTALERSTFCVVVITQDSMKSKWVANEYTYAMNHDITVIPIFLKDCKLPFSFSTTQYIDFRDINYQVAMRELYTVLNIRSVLKKH